MTDPYEEERYLDRQTYDDIMWDRSKFCQCSRCWQRYVHSTHEWQGHHSPNDIEWINDRFFRIKLNDL